MSQSTRSIYSSGMPAPQIVTTVVLQADAAGAFADTVIDASSLGIEGWFPYTAEVYSGTTPPDAATDITLENDYGLDIAGGLLANIGSPAAKAVNMGSGGFGYLPVVSDLTLKVAGNTAATADLTVRLIFVGE